jgi:formylglycine-generating enzyme required for sulfatase activity
VADFGIAHVSGEMLTRSWMTPAGFVAGTLPYMSPEQTDGVRDDPGIDVYALGAVLYRMLTGQTYLDFDTRETPRSQAVNVQRIFEEQPLPPSTHAQEIPAWLDGVVLKALAKGPKARYADAEVMGAALRQGRPAPSPTPTPARATPAGPGAPAGLGARAVPSRKKRAPLPGWFWPVAGVAGVLVVVLVITIGAVLGGGGGGETDVAAVTTAPALPVSHTPTPTATPKGTDTPRPTATATDTPKPTATSTPQPTGTPLPPAATPQAIITKVWEEDDSVMVYVPAGAFWMGSDESDLLANDDEKPQHEVTLDAFWIDRTEVTNTQYQRCVDEGACSPPLNSKSSTRDSYYGASEFDDYPVIWVTWRQADAYCTWAGKRLPTEAEWEKAARGTDKRLYPWGEGIDCSHANYGNCASDTAEVASYLQGASPYGALNMVGNVWEWVADWYASDSYGDSPGGNPQGPAGGSTRVLRGGGWYSYWPGARAAVRSHYKPGARHDYVGFRCAVPAGE